MKCPNCGHEIEEGHLICEICGHEIQIVPVFEPEIEPQIDNKIVGEAVSEGIPFSNTSDLSSTIGGSTTDRILGLSHNEEHDPKMIRRVVILSIIVVTVIAGIIAAIIGVRGANDLEHQLNRVKDKASQGRYEDAISDLENIYVSHPEESRILFMEAEYYDEMGRGDQSVDTLKRMISSGIRPGSIPKR